jgi:glutaredoxin
MTDIQFYTRQGCCLCDEARALLERYGLQLEVIDIDKSPDLVGLYGECVPVVRIDGRVRFRGRVSEVLLRRILGRGQ